MIAATATFDRDTIVPLLMQFANLDPITSGIEEDSFCFFCRSYERYDRTDKLNAPNTGSTAIEQYVQHTDTCLWIAARAALGFEVVHRHVTWVLQLGDRSEHQPQE